MAFAIENLRHDFGDVRAEVIACRNRCALFDFSFLERAEIGGGAAQRVLESFTGRSLGGLDGSCPLFLAQVLENESKGFAGLAIVPK
jgi:glycine cleavage system aminomethyltransferase T